MEYNYFRYIPWVFCLCKYLVYGLQLSEFMFKLTSRLLNILTLNFVVIFSSPSLKNYFSSFLNRSVALELVLCRTIIPSSQSNPLSLILNRYLKHQNNNKPTNSHSTANQTLSCQYYIFHCLYFFCLQISIIIQHCFFRQICYFNFFVNVKISFV